MNTVRTVSDTKRAFYQQHTRPVSSVYRRVVEELLVEIHLLRVNSTFQYDPLFALGIVTTFDRFMEGYKPEADRESIFRAIAQSEEMDPAKLRADAEQAKAVAAQKDHAAILGWIKDAAAQGGSDLAGVLHGIAQNPQFKYSRLFAVGLYTLLETADAEALADTDKLSEALGQLTSSLNLPEGKLQKDLELYRGNLDKLKQAQLAMAEMIEYERRQAEQRKARQADDSEAPAEATEPTDSAESSPEVSQQD